MPPPRWIRILPNELSHSIADAAEANVMRPTYVRASGGYSAV